MLWKLWADFWYARPPDEKSSYENRETVGPARPKAGTFVLNICATLQREPNCKRFARPAGPWQLPGASFHFTIMCICWPLSFIILVAPMSDSTNPPGCCKLRSITDVSLPTFLFRITFTLTLVEQIILTYCSHSTHLSLSHHLFTACSGYMLDDEDVYIELSLNLLSLHYCGLG